ncbi:MAG: hypothetical protein K8U03_03825 [Planctomycetia bacterium]|nr:hypothetical protein [Planctomycetia bacterium]
MRRPPSANTGVSLFPFLAVLLCTMGALVLLLMLIASQSKAQAEAAMAEAAKPKVDLEAIRRREEDLQWKIDQLTKSREKTLADVAGDRAQLSHLEEHASRLKKQLADLEAAEDLLKTQASGDAAGRGSVAADLAELRRKIAEAERKLAAEKAVGRKPQAFAVVPYDGENGTRRRPIYIECRGDAIVLQPEGIKFSEADFGGSLGPSNPLAVAVRLVSEYLTRGESYREGEQPYPLLLVRPSGIGSYYAARAGMSSWEGEFGYELIDENWPLEFPPSDPLLSQMLTKAVEEARLRQVMLARAAPSLRGKNPKATFRVSPSGGGVVQVDGGDGGERYGTRGGGRYSADRGPRAGGGGGNGLSGGYSANQPGGAPFASINGNDGRGTGVGGNSSSGTPSVPPGIGQGLDGTGPGNSAGGLVAASPTLTGGASDNRYGNGGIGNGVPATEVLPTGATNSGGPNLGGPGLGSPGGNSQPGNGQPGSAGASQYVGGPQGTGDGMTSGAPSNQFGATGNTSAAAAPSNGYSSTRSTGDSQSGNGAGGSPDGSVAGGGDSGPSGAAGASGSGSNASSGVAGTSAGQPGDGASSNAGGGSPGTPGQAGGSGSGAMGDPSAPQNVSVNMSPPQQQTGPGEYVESMARKRGKDWGLPEEARRSTPLTRPIQIYCSGNQLTLFSDKGIPDKQILMEGPTEDSIDTLVSTVWDQVTTWGIAGRGMYWKPKLVVHVAPDGAARFNELKQLLDGSGLEVSGKQISVAQPVSTGRR